MADRVYRSPFMVPITLGNPDDPRCPQMGSGTDGRCELANHHYGSHEVRRPDPSRGTVLAVQWDNCPQHAVEGHTCK